MSILLTRRFRAPLVIMMICLVGFVAVPSILYLGAPSSSSYSSTLVNNRIAQDSTIRTPGFDIDPSLNQGGVVMPKLGNETAKAELGRATWKLLHTMASRYPLKPQPDERAAVKQWIFLLSRLYPCGECAEHFQLLLKNHPPQTSSRQALSSWACSVHNIVNERLGKPEFDCSLLGDMYKCGCTDEAEEEQQQQQQSQQEQEGEEDDDNDKEPFSVAKEIMANHAGAHGSVMVDMMDETSKTGDEGVIVEGSGHDPLAVLEKVPGIMDF